MWWHVYPLGFVGADTTGRTRTPHRSLTRLHGWLDYVVDLGLSGLVLGPVFASSTHGYDTVDHFAVDPRLGTERDLVDLIDAAHARGLQIMLDGVFNHVGREFARFRAAEADPGGPDGRWFRRVGDGWQSFEGHSGLITLNHDEPAVREYTVDVMTYWLDRGADAWRLDAAYAVPTEFWADVLPQVRSRHPDTYIVGEVLHGDYTDFVKRSTVDTVTQYELWKAIWSSLADGNFFELAWALKRHDGFLESFVPYTFVGNHDVSRLASVIPDHRHLAHALVVLFTVGGMPAVYYGDEQGLTGVKEERVGGDDAVRPAYPDRPDELPADGWPIFRLHQELIALRRANPWLERARVRDIALTNTRYAYQVTAEGRSLLVLLNVADQPVAQACASGEILAGSAASADGVITVPGHGWTIVRI